MNIVAIVQARLGSTRLPAKVTADIAGETMLARVVSRLRAARTISDIVVATTDRASDDPIARLADRLEVAVFRGSEHDVLDRYARAAVDARADVIVRVTSDCPLLDPEVVDAVVSVLVHAPTCDYASNTHVRSYPRGLDVEALTAATLARLAATATSPAAREHVTAFVMERPELFAIRHVRAAQDDSDLRWTVDTADDLAMVRALYDQLGLARRLVPYRDVVAAVRARPELAAINAHVPQKSWQTGDQRVA